MRRMFAFFSFFTSTAVYICSYILMCFISRENCFFPLSGRRIVCRRGMSTCFQVTSYISPLVRHTAVSMHLLERLWTKEYMCFYRLLIEGIVCSLCGVAQLFHLNPSRFTSGLNAAKNTCYTQRYPKTF